MDPHPVLAQVAREVDALARAQPESAVGREDDAVNVSEHGGHAHGKPGLAGIVRDHDTVVACRDHVVAMRGDGEVVAEAHDRAALPRGALIVAGEQPVVGGSHPHVAGDVERVDETFELNDRRLDLLLDVDLGAAVGFSRRLEQRVGDGVARLPRQRVAWRRALRRGRGRFRSGLLGRRRRGNV